MYTNYGHLKHLHLMTQLWLGFEVHRLRLRVWGSGNIVNKIWSKNWWKTQKSAIYAGKNWVKRTTYILLWEWPWRCVLAIILHHHQSNPLVFGTLVVVRGNMSRRQHPKFGTLFLAPRILASWCVCTLDIVASRGRRRDQLICQRWLVRAVLHSNIPIQWRVTEKAAEL